MSIYEDDEEVPSLDDCDPDEVDVEVIDAFHVGNENYIVSVQLSDEYDEAARSFLVGVDMERSGDFREIFRLEDLLLSHASLAPEHHVALQVGGITHHLHGGRITKGEGPEPFTNKLWHMDKDHLFLFGEDGTICHASGTRWIPQPTPSDAFIRSMRGRRPDLIYAAGDFGTLLKFDGVEWVRVETGFDIGIWAIEVSSDDTVLFGCEDGACGMFVEGERRDLNGTGARVASICQFQELDYWGDDENGLFVRRAGRLEPFRGLGPVYNMHASRDRLAISGWNNLFSFDGSNWAGVQFAFDGDLLLRPIDMDREFT